MSNLTRRAAFAMAGLAAATPAMAATDTRRALRPFACNLDTWVTDTPFAGRFARAAKAGFTQVELWPVRPAH